MKRLFFLMLVLFAGLLLNPSPTQAQNSSWEEIVAEGIQAYNNKNYEEAIKRFTQARTIEDHADLLYNTARSYHLMGNCISAKEHYTKYVARSDADPKRSTKAATYITELGECATTGSILLVCTPATAKVSIDGEIEGKCGKFDGLSAGKHILIVSAEGYQVMDTRIDVVVGKLEATTVNLQPIAGSSNTFPKETPPTVTKSNTNWLAWSLIGGGGALLGGAGIVDLINLGVRNDIEDVNEKLVLLPSNNSLARIALQKEYDDLADSDSLNQSLIIGFGAAGLIAVATGVTFLFLDIGVDTPPQDPAQRQISWIFAPTISAEQVGGVLQVNF